LFPVKIQGDSYDFDIDESEYDNQIALSPTNVKGEGMKLKNYFCNKRVIHWFPITIYSLYCCTMHFVVTLIITPTNALALKEFIPLCENH